eukprot:12088013-Karenia_brevis.AAC.1
MLGFGSLYLGPYTCVLAKVSMDEKDYMVEQCLKRIGALHGLSTNDESALLWQIIQGIPNGSWPQVWRPIPATETLHGIMAILDIYLHRQRSNQSTWRI